MSLRVALQFLTRIPVSVPPIGSDDLARSVLWYPLVGLLLGVLLWGAAALLSGFSPALVAVLLLGLWLSLTGILHLDGFADTLDAWAGGRGERQRTLDLMKDPHVGVAAVVGLIFVLVLRLVMLWSLLTSGAIWVLLLVPWAGRMALTLLLVTTPYVRAEGLGAFLKALPRNQVLGALLLHSVLLLCTGYLGVLSLVLAAVCTGLWRRVLLQRLGGTTGDTAGALVEGVEAVLLMALALTLSD